MNISTGTREALVQGSIGTREAEKHWYQALVPEKHWFKEEEKRSRGDISMNYKVLGLKYHNSKPLKIGSAGSVHRPEGSEEQFRLEKRLVLLPIQSYHQRLVRHKFYQVILLFQ
ncbi:hypothetical protein L1887_03894 [Cichorium endivia]|nr:hypothetical protein L1887_03894 [Cichorium endivia]